MGAARGKSRIELDGQADIVAVPAYQLTVGEAAAGVTAGCGYVSDSSLPPRSEGRFKAEITQVDGPSTPLHGINRVHVASARHGLQTGQDRKSVVAGRSWADRVDHGGARK